MKLVVFDVDGTLLDNLACEDACYSQALSEGLGLHELAEDWDGYRHVSDHGVAIEAYQREFGTTPSNAAIATTITRFVELLSVAHRTRPIVAVAGAADLLTALPAHGWAVALATGAWRRAAEFKLTAAGLRTAGVPMATAEDGPARAEIVQTACTRAEQFYGGQFDRIVTVGDGVWDVRAARALALPFVGIATAARADRLRGAGASSILSDFSNRPVAIAALEAARMPISAAP